MHILTIISLRTGHHTNKVVEEGIEEDGGKQTEEGLQSVHSPHEGKLLLAEGVRHIENIELDEKDQEQRSIEHSNVQRPIRGLEPVVHLYNPSHQIYHTVDVVRRPDGLYAGVEGEDELLEE